MSPSGWANPSTLWSVLKPTIERRRTRSQSRESVAKITNRLPVGRTECRRVRNLVLRDMPAPAADDEGGGGSAHTTISDERVAEVLPWCIRLETLVLCGVSDLTDKTVALAASMPNLQGLDITGCRQVTDVGVSELAKKSQHLQWLRLGGVTNLTDATISTIAKSCSLLRELDLSDLPSLTAVSVRDLWSFSKNLNTLRLARCPLLTDKAFPSSFHTSPQTVTSGGTDKPLPPRPTTWVENLSPLILTHTADHLRELDLESCTEITDEAIAGIAAHAPKLQTLVLSGCTALTDRALGSICQLGDNLEVLMLARLAKVTDPGIVDLARKCTKIQCLDVSCTCAIREIFFVVHIAQPNWLCSRYAC
jgi:F-box and leucine-rich repeat protein GRR1